MRASSKLGNGIIGVIQGKVNKKKLSKCYNAAYKEISKLWNTLPDSAKKSLKSENTDKQGVKEDKETPTNDTFVNNSLQSLEGRIKSLKGRNASFKEKMEKKKLKNRLKKKKQNKEKQDLKEEKRKKKKELTEKIRAEKMKKSNLSDNLMVEQSTADILNGSRFVPEVDSEDNTANTEVKKHRKGAKIEDLTTEAVGEEKIASELSNKKLKILKKNQLKAEKKREKRKRLKIKRLEEVKKSLDTVKIEESETVAEEPKEDQEIMFNRIDFPVEGKKKFKKEKLKTEKDPVKALSKIEALNKKITDLKEAGMEDKAAAIQNKESWKNAILKADGVKVKDDVKLLKKTIRKKEKIKSKSQDSWKKRNDIKEKKMADAQKKRKENIMKKKKDKKQKKIKKSIKKGRVVL